MALSLRDVAAEAECSVATASRALSGHPGISAATQRRVRAAAARIGYEANGLARALRMQATQLIGLVIPRVEAYNYTASTAQLHDVLSAEGYGLLLCCHNDDAELDGRILSQLIARRVDGIVHVPCSRAGAGSVVRKQMSIPVVELLRESDRRDIDCVATDIEGGSYELTRHLIELGHRRIGLVSGVGFERGSRHYNDRADGFQRAVAEAGIDPDFCPLHIGPFDLAAGRVAGEQLLASGADALPTAIVTGSAPLALGLLEYFHTAHVEIPEFVSIASLGSVEWAASTNPALTTYELPLAEMGMLAAQMVLNRIRPQLHTDPKPSRVTLAGRLVTRSSTAAPSRP